MNNFILLMDNIALFQHTSNENKEKYQLGDYQLIQYQILQTKIIQTVQQKVKWELPNQDFGGEKVERTLTVLNIIQVYTYILKHTHKR